MPKTEISPSHILQSNSKVNVVHLDKWTCDICNCFNPENTFKCKDCGVPCTKQKSPELWPCPACTFDNQPDKQSCEMCGTKKPEQVVKSVIVPKNLDNSIMKLSFRSGNCTSFFNALKSAMQSKDWKVLENQAEKQKKLEFSPTAAGISGLMKQADLTMKEQDQSLAQAFSDIDALVNKASEMVKIAESISAKLAKDESLSESENSEFKSLMINLGMAAPVTK